MSTDAVPEEIVRNLMPGETVLWWDRPQQGILFKGRDWFLIPFSLLWGGFAIVWESTVLIGHAPLIMRLWGIPFVLVGLFFIVGRFFVDAWVRKTIVYALTEQRVLIVRAGPWRNLVAVNLSRLGDVVLDERSDGRGTVRFGQPQSIWPGGRRNSNVGSLLPALDPTPQFFAIADARAVFNKIQGLMRVGVK